MSFLRLLCVEQLNRAQRRIIQDFETATARRFVPLRGRMTFERMAEEGLLQLRERSRGLWIELTPQAHPLWEQLRESAPSC